VTGVSANIQSKQTRETKMGPKGRSIKASIRGHKAKRKTPLMPQKFRGRRSPGALALGNVSADGNRDAPIKIKNYLEGE